MNPWTDETVEGALSEECPARPAGGRAGHGVDVYLVSETNCVDGDDLASGAVGLHGFGVRP